MIDFIGFILVTAFCIWLGYGKLVELADERHEQERQERDWELSIELERHRQRCKEQALECEYGTVVGELDRIEKLGLD